MEETGNGPYESRSRDNVETVLVCGRCERILPGRYEGPGRADEAADAHVQEAHGDQARILVIPAPADLAETNPRSLIDIARRAQARVTAEPAPSASVTRDEGSE